MAICRPNSRNLVGLVVDLSGTGYRMRGVWLEPDAGNIGLDGDDYPDVLACA